MWDKPGGGRAEGGCRTQDGAVLGFARNVARAPPPHRRASAWGAFGAGASVFKMIPPEGFSGVQPGVFHASEEPALPPGGPDAPDTPDAPCHPADLDRAELGVGAPESPSPSPVAGSLGRRRGGLGGRPTCRMTQCPLSAATSRAFSATTSCPCPSDTLWSFPLSMVNPSFFPKGEKDGECGGGR